jgi:hypothetical protein
MLFSTKSDGQYVHKICQLTPAVVHYTIILDDGTVKLPKVEGQGRVLELANNTTPVDWINSSTKQLSTLDSVSFYIGTIPMSRTF